MKKILVPTNFSETANNAFQYGLNLMKTLKGSIVLMQTQLMNNTANHPYIYLYPDHERWEKEAIERYAELKEEALKTAPEIETSFVTTLGRITPDIVKTAKEEEVDYIVMGTNGAAGIGKLFGTNTADVISQSQCPVIAVPHDYVGHELSQIVFATDYQEGDQALLQQLAEFAAAFNAHIKVLHVGLDLFSKYEENKLEWYKEMIQKEIDYERISFELLEHSDVQKALSEYIDFHEVDLLVMSVKKRNLLQRMFQQSDTREMAFQAQVPLMAFHDEELQVESSPPIKRR